MPEKAVTPPSYRVLTGLVAVAILAMFASLDSYQIAARNARQYPDPYGVARADKLFPLMASRLPASSPIGYISDVPLSQDAGVTAFLAAGYALAPRLVVPLDPKMDRKPAVEWAIGNFGRPGDFAAAGAPFGLTIEADFGSGAILYRKAKP